MHICEPTIDAVVANRQLLMVYAQLMQDGRVNIVNGGVITPVLWFKSPLITFAVSAGFDAAPTHPVREYKGVVIPTSFPLRTRHATKLCSPKNDRVLQHASLFEVLDQCSRSMGHAE